MNFQVFKDKVAVITGGASGIGLAVCKEFAARGAAIAMIDKDDLALVQAAEDFNSLGNDILALSCDITDHEAVKETFDSIISKYGTVDILFNNAGITQRGLFEHTDIKVFKQVMDVNFYGSLYCTKAALPQLIRQKGTIIVNESIAGVAPLVGRTGYSASKHALHGMFTSLRCELRSQKVHVMVVCPGFIKTNLQKSALGADGKIAVHDQTKIGSEDTAEHVAQQIAQGVIRKKSNLILTPVGKLGYYLHRLSPTLYEKMMTRKLKTELSSRKQ